MKDVFIMGTITVRSKTKNAGSLAIRNEELGMEWIIKKEWCWWIAAQKRRSGNIRLVGIWKKRWTIEIAVGGQDRSLQMIFRFPATDLMVYNTFLHGGMRASRPTAQTSTDLKFLIANFSFLLSKILNCTTSAPAKPAWKQRYGSAWRESIYFNEWK